MTFEQAVSAITRTFVKMLNKAEDLFGERNKEWTFVGIEFRDGGPYILFYPSHKKVAIILSVNSSALFPNHEQLYFQLAHETYHLICPTGTSEANLLEEGAAAYFSKYYLELLFPNSTYAIEAIRESAYLESYELVEKLLSSDQEAFKKIRQINPIISYVTEEELKSLGFDLSEEEIKRLVSKFENHRPV